MRILFASAFAAFVSAQPAGEDFALRLEAVGSTSTVTVVGAWTIDEVQGWSWGLCHDPAEASVGDCAGLYSSERACEVCAAIECPQDMIDPGPGGEPIAFHAVAVYENGVTQGVMLDLAGSGTLAARDRFELLRLTYRPKGPAIHLSFCDTLGVRPARTVFVVGGMSYPPATREGLVLQLGGFMRGNANATGTLDIADAVFVLSYLFARGAPPPCMDAADANDNGAINVADAIALLAHLFSRAAIPDPFATCGSDPTEDRLGCERFAPCGKAVEG